MNITIFQTAAEMRQFFGFKQEGRILETDLHIVRNATEVNGRQLHDAAVLTILAANLQGNCLEIGTHVGKGTYKIATNTNGTVYTVNALPEQITGKLITDSLKKDQIGSFTTEKGIKNIHQFYADSMTWEIPECVNNLSMAFVDGCHDTEYVYSDSKKVFGRIRPGGFIVWHDFNPDYRNNPAFSWIKDCMAGVERFCSEMKLNRVFHLKNSYMGFYQISARDTEEKV